MNFRKIYLLSILLILCYGNILISQCPVFSFFESQEQVDNFPSEYPNCIHFEKNLFIQTINLDPITNVDSLIQLQSCYGISIADSNLVSIKGLSNIAGSFELGIRIDFAPELASLEGLEGITSVKSEFRLRNIPKVTNLLPLRNIVALENDGYAVDISNTGVTSLAGIGQIITNETVVRLWIYDNPYLEICNVKMVCDFFENITSCNGNFHYIENNSPGCNSKEEIQASCVTLSTDPDTSPFPDLKIYPNPVRDRLFIGAAEPMSFAILNNVGQVISYQDDKQLAHILDTQSLLPGIYYVKIFSEQQYTFKRIIVE